MADSMELGGFRLFPLLATLGLVACIPPGVDDYRIGRNSETPAPQQSQPQIVPEQAIIADTPSWSPAVVERNAQAVEAGDYLVQPGDTLYRIESKTGAGLAQIVSANDLPYPYVVRVGQKLTIPGGLYHRVGAGETGIAIARAYGSSWADIVSLNSLQYPYILREGQRLRLLDSAAAVPPPRDLTPEQRADAFSLNIDDIVTGGEPASSIIVAPARPATFAGAFAWPLNGTLLARFGSQGGGKVNDGINIAGANGTPVSAAADGVVVYSGNEIGVFGGLVLVDHGGGWITAYGHLGRLDVKRGDKVSAGQSLGSVGDTGYVTQPQLHFEIRKDRKPIDPLTKL
jgi:murein DD-endopeptidase MepM/ murein hydrolase activator NlpD